MFNCLLLPFLNIRWGIHRFAGNNKLNSPLKLTTLEIESCCISYTKRTDKICNVRKGNVRTYSRAPPSFHLNQIEKDLPLGFIYLFERVVLKLDHVRSKENLSSRIYSTFYHPNNKCISFRAQIKCDILKCIKPSGCIQGIKRTKIDTIKCYKCKSNWAYKCTRHEVAIVNFRSCHGNKCRWQSSTGCRNVVVHRTDIPDRLVR